MSEIISRIELIEQRLNKIEEKLNEKSEIVIKKTSLKEFLISKKPSDDLQKTLVIGYYLEKYSGVSSFNSKDLTDGFREAREKVPNNISGKIYQNIKKSYIMEDKEKKNKQKSYVLTNTGVSLVDMNFSNLK